MEMVVVEEEAAGFIGKATRSGTLRYDPDLPKQVAKGKLGCFAGIVNHMNM